MTEKPLALRYFEAFGVWPWPPLDFGHRYVPPAEWEPLARQAIADETPIDWSEHLEALPDGAAS